MNGPYITTDTLRREAWGVPCTSAATSGRVVIDGKTFPLRSDAVDAFKVWEKVRAKYKYRLTGTDTGFYSCRHIQHNDALPMSFHAWGMAMDVNWLENPAGDKLITDMPAAMIEELQFIRTTSGAYVFRWGGDWDWDGEWEDHEYVDAMHWEVVAHPLDLMTGIAYETDEGEEEEVGLLAFDIGAVGADPVTGVEVKTLQYMLLDRGYDLPKSVDDKGNPDGKAGNETRKALIEFQEDNDINNSNGRINAATYSALHSMDKTARRRAHRANSRLNKLSEI